MQEEIEHKTVNFAISTVKLSARTLLKGAQFFLRQYDFCRKLEDETLADWYDQVFYFVRAEMECYTNMLLLMQDIEEDEDWGPTIFDESEEGELIDDV